MALLLATALAGCQQEPLPESGDAIRFSVSSPSVSVETKADHTYSLPADALIVNENSISVWGSYKEGTWKSLFSDQTVKCNTGTDPISWTYSNVKYWSHDATAYLFRAAFQAGTSTTYTLDSENNTDKLTVVATGGTDLMVASNQFNAKPSDNKVPLAFQHACAAVRFFFKDESRGSSVDANYYIKSIELKNIYTSGTLNYTDVITWDVTGARTVPAYTWTASGSDERWSVPAAYDDDSTTKVASTDWLYVIPQNLNVDTNTEAALVVTFDVAGTTPTQTETVTLNLETYKGSDVIWNPGKVYAYFISLDAIEFTIESATWQPGGSFNYTGK